MTAPLVGIVMGSQSDWDVMKQAAQQLRDFGVPYEARGHTGTGHGSHDDQVDTLLGGEPGDHVSRVTLHEVHAGRSVTSWWRGASRSSSGAKLWPSCGTTPSVGR